MTAQGPALKPHVNGALGQPAVVGARSIRSSTVVSEKTGIPASAKSARVRSVTAPTRTSAGIIRSLKE